MAFNWREDLSAIMVKMIAYAKTYVATSKTTPFSLQMFSKIELSSSRVITVE